jgi:uncharacterized phage protein (TIGR01671 family)
MKDRYLFRGKNVPEKEWVIGHLVSFRDNELLDGIRTKNEYGTQHTVKVDPETVGQCTGLRDKNGKLVFEGDVFGISNSDENIKNKYYRVVKWAVGGYWLADDTNHGEPLENGISINRSTVGITEFIRQQGLDYAVIGNIHDNPELIEDQQ